MKTLCCVLAFSFATLSTFGQGTVLYQNTAGAGKEKYVYGFDSANPTSDYLGVRGRKSVRDTPLNCSGEVPEALRRI